MCHFSAPSRVLAKFFSHHQCAIFHKNRYISFNLIFSLSIRHNMFRKHRLYFWQIQSFLIMMMLVLIRDTLHGGLITKWYSGRCKSLLANKFDLKREAWPTLPCSPCTAWGLGGVSREEGGLQGRRGGLQLLDSHCLSITHTSPMLVTRIKPV